MISRLRGCPLFADMSTDDIEKCLQDSQSTVVTYEKDEMVFCQKDEPKHLLILLEGMVSICHDSSSGSRSIMAAFDQSGELFGEVFLFLHRVEYDYYARALSPAKILQIPKAFFDHSYEGKGDYHAKLISNMLSILAQKAYYLNQKLQILSCTTLRKKIAKLLLQNCSTDGKVSLSMNREELADFLNAARPSLSRELMKMHEEGLLDIKKREIYIRDMQRLESCV